MADRINENIRLYLPNDPYYFEVDNLPLEDLLTNDRRLQDQLDEIEGKLQVDSGRKAWPELQPYLNNTSNPGYVFVKPGNFLARQTMVATREGGASEGLQNSPSATTRVLNDEVNPITALDSINAKIGATARTSVVELRGNPDGSDPSIKIPDGFAEDYYPLPETPPGFRVDLVYAQGSPSIDTDNGEPGLGIINGAFFLTDGGDASRTGELLLRFNDNFNKHIGNILTQRKENVEDLGSGFINSKIDPNTGELLYTSIPLPDDVTNLNDVKAIAAVIEGSVNLESLTDAFVNSRMFFGLPIAYVFVPFNYVGNTPIPEENLYDIRPFLRTTELTYGERSSLAGSYKPGFRNRVYTREDPEPTRMRDKLDNIENFLGNFSSPEASVVYPGNQNGQQWGTFTVQELFQTAFPSANMDRISGFWVGGEVYTQEDYQENWGGESRWSNDTIGSSGRICMTRVHGDFQIGGSYDFWFYNITNPVFVPVNSSSDQLTFSKRTVGGDAGWSSGSWWISAWTERVIIDFSTFVPVGEPFSG